MKLVLDRIEKKQNGERVFVLEGDNASYYDIDEKNIPSEIIQSFKVGLILEADVIDGKLFFLKLLIDETNQKNEEMNNRLNNLFKRKKQG